jgi:hypothetical protein
VTTAQLEEIFQVCAGMHFSAFVISLIPFPFSIEENVLSRHHLFVDLL